MGQAGEEGGVYDDHVIIIILTTYPPARVSCFHHLGQTPLPPNPEGSLFFPSVQLTYDPHQAFVFILFRFIRFSGFVPTKNSCPSAAAIAMCNMLDFILSRASYSRDLEDF